MAKFRKLFSLATSPSPGLHFSDPYIGIAVLASQNQVVADIPGLSEGGQDTTRHLGNFARKEEMIQVISAFIGVESLEVPIATYCHFSVPMTPDYPIWSSMPEFFWLRPEQNFEHLIHELDRYLLESNDVYPKIVNAVSKNPVDSCLTFHDSIDFSYIYFPRN